MKHLPRSTILSQTIGRHIRRTGMSKPTVWRWQERYLEEGVQRLKRDKTRPSRVPPLPREVQLKLIAKTVQEAPPNTLRCPVKRGLDHGEVIARHPQCYGREDMVFHRPDPLPPTDRTQDQCFGPCRAPCGVGLTRRVHHAAPHNRSSCLGIGGHPSRSRSVYRNPLRARGFSDFPLVSTTYAWHREEQKQ
jgi:hypothetical protein